MLWQRGSESLPAEVSALPNLELIELPFEQSEGASWARRQLQDRWSGEPYTLLLDSHHRFVPHWDSELESMYNQAAKRSGNPMISAYLPDYVPELEPYGRAQRPLKIYPFRREHGVLAQLAGYPLPFWTELDEPDSGEFLSLHFVFARGQFNSEIKFDFDAYYLRDEVLASLQAYTWGYDVFHPQWVLGWHAYDRSSRSPHWLGRNDWHVGQDEVLARLRSVFLGFQPSALGSIRSIAEFEARTMTRLVEA